MNANFVSFEICNMTRKIHLSSKIIPMLCLPSWSMLCFAYFNQTLGGVYIFLHHQSVFVPGVQKSKIVHQGGCNVGQQAAAVFRLEIKYNNGAAALTRESLCEAHSSEEKHPFSATPSPYIYPFSPNTIERPAVSCFKAPALR